MTLSSIRPWVLSITLTLSCTLWLVPLSAFAEDFRIVGYLPDYRASQLSTIQVDRLTDLILFSAEVGKDGELDMIRMKEMPWEQLKLLKTRHRFRLILCLGGWDRSTHFAEVAASSKKRATLIKSAIELCKEQRLDGIDIDWEHPKDEHEEQRYADLLVEFGKAFRVHGLMLTVTMAPWQRLSKQGFEAVDGIQLMAYDNPERHSTLNAAREAIEQTMARGAKADRISLGIPFYGRHVQRGGETKTYREIVEKFHPPGDIDEVESIYFNGKKMVRAKVELAKSMKIGGVMVWELGQDASGDESLLNVIHQAVQAR